MRIWIASKGCKAGFKSSFADCAICKETGRSLLHTFEVALSCVTSHMNIRRSSAQLKIVTIERKYNLNCHQQCMVHLDSCGTCGYSLTETPL